MISQAIREPDKDEPDKYRSLESAVHSSVACDGFGMDPVIGPRYKCCFRKTYDLCERCESADSSPYLSLKLMTPEGDELNVLFFDGAFDG